ncbi:MAG: mannose-1-phosphate guanyltransferase, partial [Proteobacteria bacterium]
MNVMLLAAGEGTRLRPHTLLRPKPAMPFLNVPLAAYPLGFLENLKIDRLVVNTFHLPTKIVDLFIQMDHGARRLHFSHEINQIMGSGGGLSMARDYFRGNGDLIMMNSDEVILPFEPDVMAKAIEFHKSNNAFCTLLTMDHHEVGSKFGGVWLDEAERVRGFGKTAPDATGKKAEHFIGVQILSEEVFDFLPQGHASNILYDAVTQAMQKGRLVQRLKIDCHWFETGNAVDFLGATEQVLHLLSSADSNEYSRKYLNRVLKRFSKDTPLLSASDDGCVLKSPTSVI